MTRDYIFFADRGVVPKTGPGRPDAVGTTCAAWRDSSGNVYYDFADAIGSTRAATNSTGTTCFSADYYPYGHENDYTTSCSPTYKFAGYEYDSETGNYYAYARYYNPRLGRFMSPDPLGGNIGNPQSLNRYTYVLNNPETLIDPLGLDTSSSNCSTTDSCSVHVTATPVCYGPPQIGDPFAGFWGYVPYYSETACLLMQEQMGAGGAAIFDSPTSNPGLPAIAYTYGGRQHPNGPQAHPLANCIANSGNEASLQGLPGLGNSKIAGAFLGNPFSDAIQFFAGGSSAAAAAGDAASAAAPATLKAVPNVSVSYTSTTVTASPSELTVITNEINAFLPLGDIATGAAEVLGGFTKLVQIPVDLAATGFGAVVCAAGLAGS